MTRFVGTRKYYMYYHYTWYQHDIALIDTLLLGFPRGTLPGAVPIPPCFGTFNGSDRKRCRYCEYWFLCRGYTLAKKLTEDYRKRAIELLSRCRSLTEMLNVAVEMEEGLDND